MTEEVSQAEAPAAVEAETHDVAEQVAEPAPAEVKEQPKPDPVQRRIDKLTREKYQLRGRLEALERERETWSNQRQQQAERVQEPGVPKLEQFDNFEDYVAAKAEYVADRKLQKAFEEREQRQNQIRAQESQEQRAENWQKQLSKARESIADLDDVLESAEVSISAHLANAIMESDLGPQVAYYLAQNPQEAEKIAGMSPSAAARAVGRIEARIENEGQKKQVSEAPKPPKPVSGSGAGPKVLETSSYDDFVKLRRKQVAARR